VNPARASGSFGRDISFTEYDVPVAVVAMLGS